MEHCVSAAMLMPDGTRIRGHRHNNCITAAVNAGFTREEIAYAKQGFVTNQGRFVGRMEAMDLQKVSGVPSKMRPDGSYQGAVLFSEDLY